MARGGALPCTARELLRRGHLKLTGGITAACGVVHAREQLQAGERPQAEGKQCQRDNRAQHWQCVNESTDNGPQVVKPVDGA